MKRMIYLIVFLFLLSYVSAYEIEYVHQDHLGNNVAITNEEGDVIWKADYEPFGSSFNEVGDNNKKYNNKEEDSTNLLYYGARYYDNDIGRFTTPDPLSGSITDPQTLNRYVYVKNNPLKYIDPTGMKEATIFMGDLGENSEYDAYLFNMKIYSSNKAYADAFVESAIYLKSAYEKEGYNVNIILGYQSSEESKSILEKEFGIIALEKYDVLSKATSLMEGSSSDDLVAFLAHSSKKNDEWGVALVMSEVIWESYGSDGEETTTTYTYSEGLDITNSYDELGFNFFISDEHEVDVFEGKCEIFGCGIINDGGVYGKGLVAAAAGRRYQSYKQIVDQFNFMADKDYEWFKDKVYKNP